MDDHLLELTSRAEATHFWFQGFRAFVAPVLADVAGGRRDLRIVDCGCGTGNNLALLQPYGRTFAFDLTEGGLRRARSSGRPLVRADITRIPLASNAFDMATSFDVLQMLPDAAAAVREMARIVRPGGAVVISVAALEILRGDHSEAWNEVQRHTPQTVRGLLEQAGLIVERTTFLFASLVPMMFVARLVQRLTRPFRAHRPAADIAVPAAPINLALASLVRAEAVVSRRLPMPVGSSLLVVGRKRS